MLDYPPVITRVCKHCKANVTWKRQGSGRPRQGRMDYWYTSDHCCPESDSACAALSSERLTLEKILSENLF
jgi:hypothetical protein